MFSEDSYNNSLPKNSNRLGTLIGNWYEEHVLRTTNGEARTIPQRHVRRSGLLVDFTRKPLEVRKQDDTFERVSGSKVTEAPNRFLTTNFDLQPDLNPKEAALRPRDVLIDSELETIAANRVKATEDKIASDLDEKSLYTTYSSQFVPLPDSRPSTKFVRKNPNWQPNEELTVKVRPSKDIPYYASPALTFAAELRSAPNFRRYTEFSQPLELATRGDRFKDESGVRPDAPAIAAGSLDTLPGLRKSLRDNLELGRLQVELSPMLQGGFVSTDAVRAAIAELFPEWPGLAKYMSYVDSQLSTMKRGYVRLSDLLKDIAPL